MMIYFFVWQKSCIFATNVYENKNEVTNNFIADKLSWTFKC